MAEKEALPSGKLGRRKDDIVTFAEKKKFLLNLLFLAVCVLLYYVGVKYVLMWVMPFLIALLISACLQRPIRFLSERTRIGKRLWSIILVAVTFLVLGFLLFIVGYQLVGEIGSFVNDLYRYLTEALPAHSQNFEKDWEFFLASLTPSVRDAVNGIASAVGENLSSILTGITSAAGTAIAALTTKIPGFLVAFIITIVSTFFFCMDYASIKAFFRMQLPMRYRKIAGETKNYMVSTVFKMARSYLFIMLITFTELTIGFLLIGIDYPLIIAALIAVVDILPVLGTGTVLIPWAIIALISGNWVLALELAAIYAVITVVRNVIEPKIVGTQIGLHPIVTLVSMYLGLQFFGVLGMFLLPLTIILLRQLQSVGVIHLWNAEDDEEPHGPASPPVSPVEGLTEVDAVSIDED